MKEADEKRRKKEALAYEYWASGMSYNDISKVMHISSSAAADYCKRYISRMKEEKNV